MSIGFPNDPSGVRAYDPEYPLFSITQVLSALNQEGNDNKVRKYNEAQVNIFLYKGVHHYIDCRSPDLFTLSKEELCDNEVVKLCLSEANLSASYYVEP